MRYKKINQLIFVVNQLTNQICYENITHDRAMMIGAIKAAQKWSFPLRVSSVNVTKSVVPYGFGYIY